MSRKTWAKPAAVSIVLSLMASSGTATTRDSTQLASDFATCAGRMAAVIEHGDTLGLGPAQVAAHHAVFSDLLDAVTPDAALAGLDAHALREAERAAKFGQWVLLQTAAYTFDARQARAATSMARRNIAMCEMMLLS